MSGAEVHQTKATQQSEPHPDSGVKAPQGSGSPTSYDAEVLFRPWKMGKHELKNRIVYAPLTRCRAANPGHVPQDNAVEYYSQRARGCEGGLIITEATVVSETGHG